MQNLQEPITIPWLPRPLLVGGIVGLTILASLAIGHFAAQGSLMMVAALAFPSLALMGALFAIRYLEFLVLVLPVTALAMRFAAIPTGTESPLHISLVLSLGLVGIWLVTMFTHGDWQIPKTSFNRSLFTFMAICCISLPWGILWRDPILNMAAMGNGFPITQTASLASIVISMWVPYLVGYYIDREWKIKFYLWAFVIGGTLMTITQILEIEQYILTDAGLWGLWYSAILFSVILVLPGVAWVWRAACLGLLGMHMYLVVILNSGWLSGWVPGILGIGAIIFLYSRKYFFMLTLALVLIGIGPAGFYIEEIIAAETEEGGLERLDIWERSLGIVAQHWLFGMGPAGYAPYNMTYFPWDARSTHNNFFDVVGQFGVLGLLAWCWFMGTSLWFGWKTVNRAPPGFLRTVAIIATGGWVGAFASMMLGDWILPFAYNQGIKGYPYTVYSWIFLGLLVSVHRMLDAQDAG
ncbi:MAG: O-antigen ligase domain-containing protein [Candidatus Viridilinea halotolerans]|uniref:O-antigen ligase domain-containing protein n=1 Tax=Candidatus Viridilinea halotolerans TaxID=2491704 RepID=A0A426U149_9CHLR|nr:MAG: O-antigen ligase domain-containing protein [Candidatus Viridilinea halotolerans]